MTTTLENLNVLVIDCQATNANPEKGQILEIGWGVTQASVYHIGELPGTETFLLTLPENSDIPRQVTRITGISKDDVSGSSNPAMVWENLIASARKIASALGRETCPAIIHFARYETPFLWKLHTTYSPGKDFPFEIVCTHEIAKRLLPGLPRRGLRAVAGYFGYSVAELRRCEHHINATSFIWKEFVDVLNKNYAIQTFEELTRWLKTTVASPRSDRIYPMESGIRLGLPDKPGVYRMLRSNGDVLYVGKAGSLRRRVNSYFQKRSSHAEHILEMLSQAQSIDVTETGSALEAAMLESDEIKRLTPPYNVSLRERDRKIRFCSDDFSSFSFNADAGHIIGPLPNEEPLKQFPVIMTLLENCADTISFEEIHKTLGIPPEYAPDSDCFRQGVSLFREKHAGLLNSLSGTRALIKIGTHSWRERHEDSALEETEKVSNDTEKNTDEDSSSEDWIWTPDAVAGAIERVVRHGAHAVRRARWFCSLSESTLTWRPGETAGSLWHILVLENGAAAFSTNDSSSDIPHVPPEYKARQQDRQRCFDVKTYDRMRVLTTEIRRLVSEKRAVELRLSPTSVLRKNELERMLAWV